MTKIPALLVVSLSLVGPLGCDEEQSTLDYDAIIHVDLKAVRSSPWMGIGGAHSGSIELAGSLGPECGDVLRQAGAVTLGVGNGAAEIYVDDAPRGLTERCFDGLIASEEAKEHAVAQKWVGKDTYAVAISETAKTPEPSARRQAELAAADPSAAGHQPVWFTVRDATAKDSFEYAEGWVDPRKGLNAHVSAQFGASEQVQALVGKASLMLIAMRLDEQTAGLADKIDVQARGQTLTVKVDASTAQMKRAMLTAKASVSATSETKNPGTSFKIEVSE